MTIRCDGVNPGLLGMTRVISEDALRRALIAIPEDAGVSWLDGHLLLLVLNFRKNLAFPVGVGVF